MCCAVLCSNWSSFIEYLWDYWVHLFWFVFSFNHGAICAGRGAKGGRNEDPPAIFSPVQGLWGEEAKLRVKVGAIRAHNAWAFS